MIRIIFCIALFASTSRAFQVPELRGRVNDYAGTMSQAERDKIEAKLAAHEAASSDQVVILTVKSLEGMSREQYAQRVFEAWKIGTKQHDNGVLILQSTGDRQLYILTGRGMEGRLPDGLCGEIRDKMTPHFKAGKFYDGYDAGTTAVIAAVNGEYKQAAASSSDWSILYLVLIVIAGLVTIVVGLAGPLPGGVTGAVLGTLLTGLLVGGILPTLIVGAILFLIGVLAKAFAESDAGGFVADFGGGGGGGGGGYSGGGGCSDGGGAGGDY